jgi:hypothetical protein
MLDDNGDRERAGEDAEVPGLSPSVSVSDADASAPFMTPGELAADLQVSVKSIYRWALGRFLHTAIAARHWQRLNAAFPLVSALCAGCASARASLAERPSRKLMPSRREPSDFVAIPSERNGACANS